jgi:hypothetical protein
MLQHLFTKPVFCYTCSTWHSSCTLFGQVVACLCDMMRHIVFAQQRHPVLHAQPQT